jgi:hypothetical protein
MESRHSDNEILALRVRQKPQRRGASSTCTVNLDITIPPAPVVEKDVVKPKHVIFTLDNSGSMGSKTGVSKLDLLKQSVIKLIESNLNDDDVISINFFNTETQLIADHCRVDQFKNQQSRERQQFASVVASGCTLIENGFLAAPVNKDMDANYEHVSIVITDGLDFQGEALEKAGKTVKTNAHKVMDSLRGKYGEHVIVIPVIIGNDPSFDLARQLVELSKSNIQLYIKSANDITREIAKLGRILEKSKQASFKIALTLGKQTVEFDNFGQAQPGYVYTRTFDLPLSDVQGETEVLFSYTQNEVNFPAQSVSFTLIQPTINQKIVGRIEDIEQSAIKYCDDVLSSSLYKSLLDKEGKDIRRMTALSVIEEKDLEKIEDLFDELLSYHDQLANQHDLDCSSTLNLLTKLMVQLSYVCKVNRCMVGREGANFAVIPLGMQGIDSGDKTMTTNTASLPKQLLEIVAPDNVGPRTVSSYQALQHVAGDMIEIDKNDGRAVILFKEASPHLKQNHLVHRYKVIDSQFDFSQYIVNPSAPGLISLDGTPNNREGILITPGKEAHNYLEMTNVIHEGMKTIITSRAKTRATPTLADYLSAHSHVMKIQVKNPADEEAIKLKLASFYNPMLLRFQSGKQVPCVELSSFLSGHEGFCRHQVLVNAISLGQAVASKLIPGMEEAKVTIYRATTYNRCGHAVNLVETADKSALYLVDTTLASNKAYNLRDPEELAAIVKIYNDKGLNGFLCSLIQSKQLPMQMKDALLAIGVFDRAMLEAFDDDDRFTPFRCMIEGVTPSDPVHLILMNERGEHYVDEKQVYERSSIEAWMQRGGKSPTSDERIVGLQEATAVKQQILLLMNQVAPSSKPEEAVTVATSVSQESQARIALRNSNKEKYFAAWAGEKIDHHAAAILPSPSVTPEKAITLGMSVLSTNNEKQVAVSSGGKEDHYPAITFDNPASSSRPSSQVASRQLERRAVKKEMFELLASSGERLLQTKPAVVTKTAVDAPQTVAAAKKESNKIAPGKLAFFDGFLSSHPAKPPAEPTKPVSSQPAMAAQSPQVTQGLYGKTNNRAPMKKPLSQETGFSSWFKFS